MMRLPAYLIICSTLAACPVSAVADDKIIRMSCDGVQEMNTIPISGPNDRKTKERKSATITMNPETGFAEFQNLGLVAFKMANEPIVCAITSSEINCAKKSAYAELQFESAVWINRYSGLLTESQTVISMGRNKFVTTISGEYECQALEKPLF